MMAACFLCVGGTDTSGLMCMCVRMCVHMYVLVYLCILLQQSHSLPGTLLLPCMQNYPPVHQQAVGVPDPGLSAFVLASDLHPPFVEGSDAKGGTSGQVNTNYV